jgi:hypothetical protein
MILAGFCKEHRNIRNKPLLFDVKGIRLIKTAGNLYFRVSLEENHIIIYHIKQGGR